MYVIAQEKLQSPLQVLNCLAVENGPNLSSVREYFLQVFQRENDSTKQVFKRFCFYLYINVKLILIFIIFKKNIRKKNLLKNIVKTQLH